MKIFGFTITRDNPIAKKRDTHQFGRVVYNIQIREKGGVTLADADGTKTPIVGHEVNPRAWLLGFVAAEKFNANWPIVSGLPDSEMSEWNKLSNEYIKSGIPTPYTKAMNEIVAAYGKNIYDGGMYR